MTLQSNRELEVTRRKLSELEQLYAKTLTSPTENGYARELTLRSLRGRINQLKEEIARFETRPSSSVQESK